MHKDAHVCDTRCFRARIGEWNLRARKNVGTTACYAGYAMLCYSRSILCPVDDSISKRTIGKVLSSLSESGAGIRDQAKVSSQNQRTVDRTPPCATRSIDEVRDVTLCAASEEDLEEKIRSLVSIRFNPRSCQQRLFKSGACK